MNKSSIAIFFFFVAVLYLIARFATPYMALASASYCLLFCGVFFVKNRNPHALLMSAGVTIDIMLVLILELTRSAIAEAISAPLNFLQRGHIGCSLLAVILYFPTMFLGYTAWKRGGKGKAHKRIGWIAFCFRSVGFLLMFSLLSKIQTRP